jgi:predicted dienelactone hydrolase
MQRLCLTRKCPAVFYLLFIIAAICAPAAATEKSAEEKYAAGVSEGKFINALGDAPFALWYPSHAAEYPIRLGAFDARAARDGEPAAKQKGLFPVVLLSHGYTGNRHNHHLTAAALAREGFVVVAPQHTSDAAERKGEMDKTAAITIRLGDLAAALSAAKKHPTFMQTADDSRIAVVGYSLGGLTAIAAAGGRPQMAAWKTHCRENGDKDPVACREGFFAIIRALRFVRETLRRFREWRGLPPRKKQTADDDDEEESGAEEIQPPPLSDDITKKVRAVVAVAPVGAAFDGDSANDIRAPVFIHRFGGDRVLAYPFHAEHLRELLGERAEYQVHDGIHHYAFVAPFASHIKRDFPAALDPPGFDRGAFIRKINRQIIASLRPLLSPPPVIK